MKGESTFKITSKEVLYQALYYTGYTGMEYLPEWPNWSRPASPSVLFTLSNSELARLFCEFPEPTNPSK